MNQRRVVPWADVKNVSRPRDKSDASGASFFTLDLAIVLKGKFTMPRMGLERANRRLRVDGIEFLCRKVCSLDPVRN